MNFFSEFVTQREKAKKETIYVGIGVSIVAGAMAIAFVLLMLISNRIDGEINRIGLILSDQRYFQARLDIAREQQQIDALGSYLLALGEADYRYESIRDYTPKENEIIAQCLPPGVSVTEMARTGNGVTLTMATSNINAIPATLENLEQTALFTTVVFDGGIQGQDGVFDFTMTCKY
ncbi:MAG: PilN domain-containing protein [Clostridiales bacterium]|jgi:Tfp pilus assembly protein PilN|nr:PilN domain-containing protein [Clostridiales bacterium]